MRRLYIVLFAFLLFAPQADAQTGFIDTVAGANFDGFSGDGGPATSALLSRPTDLAYDAAGNLFIADAGNHRVRRVAAGADGLVTGAADEIITTVAALPPTASSPRFRVAPRSSWSMRRIDR